MRNHGKPWTNTTRSKNPTHQQIKKHWCPSSEKQDSRSHCRENAFDFKKSKTYFLRKSCYFVRHMHRWFGAITIEKTLCWKRAKRDFVYKSRGKHSKTCFFHLKHNVFTIDIARQKCLLLPVPSDIAIYEKNRKLKQQKKENRDRKHCLPAGVFSSSLTSSRPSVRGFWKFQRSARAKIRERRRFRKKTEKNEDEKREIFGLSY